MGVRLVSLFRVLFLLYSLFPLIISKDGEFSGKDITNSVFGTNSKEFFPVAYADFNSDKITDIFCLTRDQSSLIIYFGEEDSPAPLFSQVVNNQSDSGIKCTLEVNWTSLGYASNTPVKIVGVTPADFTGDGILDVLITYQRYEKDEFFGRHNNVSIIPVESVIFKGNLTSLHCGILIEKHNVISNLVQEPLALDLNGDMIMDLFGEIYEPHDHHKNRTSNKNYKIKKGIWIFLDESLSMNRVIIPPNMTEFHEVNDKIDERDENNDDEEKEKNEKCMDPHGNSYVDLDGDGEPELVLITSKISKKSGDKNEYKRKVYKIKHSQDDHISFELSSELNIEKNVIGQPLFLDFLQNGSLMNLVPFCDQNECKGGLNGILVLSHSKVHILPIEFSDNSGSWVYINPEHKNMSTHVHSNYSVNTITLRAGDFNLDGFVDLIGVLKKKGEEGNEGTNGRAVLFENIPCVSSTTVSCPFPRTFKINTEALKEYTNVTLATFFDIHENGLVDVIVVKRDDNSTKPYEDKYSAAAFLNSPDYDANFIKVMVLSGRDCRLCPSSQTPYGNLLSGPQITYRTTTQAGYFQTATSAQFYRSAHMSLDLPYTIMGIGQSPNFIETLIISVPSDGKVYESAWEQIIPNSQISIVPSPLHNPNFWNAKLFLTPSSAVVNTLFVLIGFCVLIAIITVILHLRERVEDKKERLKEIHRFHMM